MKKLTIIVAMIAFAIATQAQTAVRTNIVPAPTVFELKAITLLDAQAVPSSDVYEITLSGSEKGVTYQLYCTEEVDGKTMKVAVGNPVQGTGNPLTFKVDEAGEYTASGSSDKVNGCMTDMKGVVSYVEKPTVEYSIDGGKTWILVDDEGVEINDKAMIRVYHGEPPSIPEKTGWDVSSYAAIFIFLLVVILIIYGIINRKKLILGEHREMKNPFTGTISRKR